MAVDFLLICKYKLGNKKYSSGGGRHDNSLNSTGEGWFPTKRLLHDCPSNGLFWGGVLVCSWIRQGAAGSLAPRAAGLPLQLPQRSLRPSAEELQPFRDLDRDGDHIERGGEGERGGRRWLWDVLSQLKRARRAGGRVRVGDLHGERAREEMRTVDCQVGYFHLKHSVALLCRSQKVKISRLKSKFCEWSRNVETEVTSFVIKDERLCAQVSWCPSVFTRVNLEIFTLVSKLFLLFREYLSVIGKRIVATTEVVAGGLRFPTEKRKLLWWNWKYVTRLAHTAIRLQSQNSDFVLESSDFILGIFKIFIYLFLNKLSCCSADLPTKEY